MLLGVKKFIEEFKEPFNKEAKALKMAKAKFQKEGTKPDKEQLEEEKLRILGEWERKRDNGEEIQKKLCEKELMTNSKAVLETYKNTDELYEQSDENVSKLENNTTYLEKALLSIKDGLIGYADKIDVYRNTINITDNKALSKLYRTSSYKTNNGFVVNGEKMFPPLNHLDQCNYNDAVLQVSLYMYLAWENNKHLKIGKLFINHIVTNDNGKISDTKLIEVPYMKDEVKKMLKYKKLND